MANLDHAFFYASENGDRVYSADSFEYWLKKFFTSGVFTGDLQVTANDDMTVTLAGGYINIDGKVRYFQESQSFLLETADATYDRIDSVVIERNDSDRDITAKVVTGGYSSSPVPLTPTRESGVDQRVVAQISVVHGAVKITQADITDTRSDTDLCGIVAGTVTEMDFSQMQAQFDSYFANYKTAIAEQYTAYLAEIQRLEDAGALSYENLVETFNSYTTEQQNMFTEWFNGMESQFDTWFASMKDQLSEDAAGNLQNEIDDADADNVLRSGFINGTAVRTTIDGKKAWLETADDGRYIQTIWQDGGAIERTLYGSGGIEVKKVTYAKQADGSWQMTN